MVSEYELNATLRAAIATWANLCGFKIKNIQLEVKLNAGDNEALITGLVSGGRVYMVTRGILADEADWKQIEDLKMTAEQRTMIDAAHQDESHRFLFGEVVSVDQFISQAQKFNRLFRRQGLRVRFMRYHGGACRLYKVSPRPDVKPSRIQVTVNDNQNNEQ